MINLEILQQFIKKRRNLIIVIAIVILAFFLGWRGFYLDGNTPFHSFILTLGLFVLEWTDYKDSTLLDVATLLATIATSYGFYHIFLSKYFNSLNIKKIQRNSYNLIIGLSEQNVELLENSSSNETEKVPTIIIEKDKDHPLIDYFKKEGFAVKALDANKAILNLDLTHVERIVISTSNDRKNIALGKRLMRKMKNDKKQSIYVSIGNRDLSVLFKQNVISNDENKNINVFAFSLYENMAKKLFLEHSILGNQVEIVNGSESFSMIVVGDSDLALEIVYHIAFLSTLPNENKLILHLLDTNAEKFKRKIQKTFPNIDDIPHLSIKAKDIDTESLEFYRDEIWDCDNLTNIFISTKNEEKNLEIAINLQDTTYVRKIGHKRFKTKVLFALYHNLGLGEEINKNKDAFANFFTFGNIAETSTQEILFDENLDYIAKLIHHDYRDIGKIDEEEMYQNWLETSPHKRNANKTQALHIDVKLLAFGLKGVESKDEFSELLIENKKIFYDKVSNSDKIEKYLEDYKLSYYPTSFDDTLIDKVARSEHNRWNAFHYLDGWQYKRVRNDEAKEHNCLQKLKEFIDDDMKKTYQYDLSSVYYIPKYLAYAGYKIVKYDYNPNRTN